MKICIYGAGAIGGFLAAYLVRAGHDTALIARGKNLSAIREFGLTLKHGTDRFTVYPNCTQCPADVGFVDAVFVTVKGPSLPHVGQNIGPLLDKNTSVIFAMNGIPWWYAAQNQHFGAGAGEILDPSGCLNRLVGYQRAIGCVIDCPAQVSEPGTVVCNRRAKGKFTLGEPDCFESLRVLELSKVLENSGIEATVSLNIREIIWSKLIINLSRSPISVLTGNTEIQLANDKIITEISRDLIEEAANVAKAHGIVLELDWDSLLKPSYRTNHRPSMLQDWDAQRPMEIDSIIRIVSYFGSVANIKTPTIDRIGALLVLKAQEAGLR